MKKRINTVIVMVLLISFLIYQVNEIRVQALPIAVPAGAVVIIAGGLIVKGCYSNDHESMTEMVQYTWNNISTEMQNEAVRLSLYKDTGVIITQSLLGAINDAITKRFGEQTGNVTEGKMVEAGSGYTWPVNGVKSFSMVNGDVYSVAIVSSHRIEIYKNGVLYNAITRPEQNAGYGDCGIKFDGKLYLRYCLAGYTTWDNWIDFGSIPSSLASVEEGAWSWDLEGNREEKEPKRIPLPPGGIPESASDADDWAWNNTDGKTSDSIDSPASNTDVTADTTGIAGAVRSIRNLVESIADFFNPNMQKTLNLEPLKMSAALFTTRFPFSLPWDFLRAFTSMQTTGAWEPKFSFTLPAGLVVGSAYDLTIDLSMWNDAADLARKFELLGFDIGLILLTRKLLGGDV